MRRVLRIGLAVPHLNPGGVETFILRLARYLSSAGHEVTVLADTEPGSWWHRLQKLDVESQCLPLERSCSPWIHLLRVGKKLNTARFDALLLNHAPWVQRALSMLPPSVAAIPVIHNHDPRVYHVACRNPAAWNLAVGVSPRICETARALLVHKPIAEISYGIELPSPAEWNRRIPAAKPLRLLYLGRVVHQQKGVLLLPEILRTCRNRGVDLTLTVVGDGPDLGELIERMAALGLSDITRFKPAVPAEEVPPVLRQHHVLLMPSYYEGLPIVSLEAQAAGCVVVASRLPGITDAALTHRESGLLVDPGDIEGFADAVESLFRNPDIWTQMSRSGYIRATRTFSVETMARKYLEVIEAAREGCYQAPTRRGYSFPLDRSMLSVRAMIPTRRKNGGAGRRAA